MLGPSRARVRIAVRALSLVLVMGSVASAPGCASRSRHSRQGATDDPATPDASPADKHYDVAVGSFHNGMFEDAKLQLDRALRADPDHADSYYLQGVLLLNEARTLVDAVESQQCLQDDAAQLQRQRAQQLHAQARESFATAATRYPEGAAGRGRANNSLAAVSLFFQEHEAAIEHSRAALEQQFYADRYSALANMGWAYYNLGDLVSATNELRQAVLLNPDFCVGRYRLAQVYLDSGLAEQAVEEARAVALDPRCPIQDAHRILGVASLRIGDEVAARDAFGSCVTLAPRSCLALDCSRFLGSEPSAADAIAQGPP